LPGPDRGDNGLVLVRCLTVAAVAVLAVTAVGARGADDPVRVGLVLDSAGGPDYPLNRLQVDGVRRAVEELGVRAEVVTPAPNEGGAAAVARFGRQGYDLVIGFDYDTMVAVATDLAKRFPRTAFALLETSRGELGHPPANVIGVPFASHEVGYLVGYLAGLMERRRPGKDTVGVVGGFRIDPVDRFIGGFDAGARRASPGIRVLTDYSESFVDPAKCRRVALAQLARGAGTLFDVAGGCGLGTLGAAKSRGRWALGVDFDRSALGPHVLTSAVKRYDVVIFELIRALARHRLQLGRDYPQTVANGALALGTFSPLVPAAVRKQVQAMARDVAAGRVDGIPRLPRP
jgi:basic membrane protein A